MQSLAGTFARLEPHLPNALVSGTARQRLTVKAATLPAALGRCLYVECRPDDPDSADLIVDVEASGFAILAGENPHVALVSSQLVSPAWSRIAALARAWTSTASPLRGRIDGIWLEFDLSGEKVAEAAPNLFVDFSPAAYLAESTAARLEPLADVAWLVDYPFDHAQRRAIHDLIATLPPHAVLLYAGFMLARDTDAVRLCIMGLTRLELVTFLRAAHWSGHMDGMTALVDAIAEPTGGGQRQPAIVHLDVDAGGSTRASSLGLEYPLSRRSQLAGVFTERALLDTLAARGLLSPAQRSELDAWPGYERVTMPHELWSSILTRRVNHVKLVQPPGGPLRAKLYLCAEHLPSPREVASTTASA
jgi:hypothetical protein